MFVYWTSVHAKAYVQTAAAGGLRQSDVTALPLRAGLAADPPLYNVCPLQIVLSCIIVHHRWTCCRAT